MAEFQNHPLSMKRKVQNKGIWKGYPKGLLLHQQANQCKHDEVGPDHFRNSAWGHHS